LRTLRDGQRVEALRPGDYFGEIAQLREFRRTATVTARTDLDFFTLGRENFVAAVTGSADSTADSVIARRLGALRSSVASSSEPTSGAI
jgi:CRP-like cAMP-binding protein